MDFAGEIRIVLLCGFEDHLAACLDGDIGEATFGANLGAIGEFVRSKVDLAKGSLAYKST